MQQLSKQRIKGVIFDLDGTLANTMPSLIYCINRVLDDLNLSHPNKQVYYDAVGHGARRFVDTVVRLQSSNFDAELSERAFQLYMQYFNTYCKQDIAFYEGMPELLQALCRRGVRLAVISNKPEPQTLMVINDCLTPAGVHYDFIFGQNDRFPKKPDPASILYVIKSWGFAPDEVCVVGDGDTDIEAGLSAGTETIGVSWGFRKRKVLEEVGAPKIVDSVSELRSELLSEVENG